MIDTSLQKAEAQKDMDRHDIREVDPPGQEDETVWEQTKRVAAPEETPPVEEEDVFDFDQIRINSVYGSDADTTSDAMSEITALFAEEEEIPEPEEVFEESGEKTLEMTQEPPADDKPKAVPKKTQGDRRSLLRLRCRIRYIRECRAMFQKIYASSHQQASEGEKKSGDSTRELKETAQRLQQTLQTFGVKVKITDISQGPAVTRYELQPEQGVKVSKIVGLTDDIKLNLAATDIRMEAPIPGKAAIGIEVPNKENTSVALRELIEAKEFKDFLQSCLCRREGYRREDRGGGYCEDASYADRRRYRFRKIRVHQHTDYEYSV